MGQTVTQTTLKYCPTYSQAGLSRCTEEVQVRKRCNISKKMAEVSDSDGRGQRQQRQNTSALDGAKFKLNCSPITMPIIVSSCSKLRLVAFHLGHTPYGGSKVPCRFLSSDTLCRSPFQALQGHFMTGVGQVIRFQTARGPWLGATAKSYGSVAGSHGKELRFDTNLGDEYHRFMCLKPTLSTCQYLTLP